MEAKETISQMMSKVCITDKRVEGKVKYSLLPSIFAIIIAWCAGCNSCVMVESYWKYNRTKLKELIEGFPDTDISHDTVNRIMRNVVFSEFHSFWFSPKKCGIFVQSSLKDLHLCLEASKSLRKKYSSSGRP